MRIALVTDGIWPYVLGGMQKHSYYLCKYLAAKGVEVHLVHFNQSGYDISRLEFFTEEEKRFIRPLVVPFPSSPRFPGHYLYNSYRYSKLAATALLTQGSSYDFIYTKGFTAWHFQKVKQHFGCEVGVNFHGYEMFQRPPDLKTSLQHRLLLRIPVRKITRNADVVFSYGGKITKIIEKLGVAREKIFELPSGVEESLLDDVRIAPTGEKIEFVFLGRYERRKGVEELNKAIIILSLGNPSLEAGFHFIGPIPGSLQLTDKHVKYHGEIRDKAELRSLLSNCDVLVCPSWSEGMPNVILEAMANGLTVLATDAGATAIMVNDNTGWLIPSPEPTVIKTAILSIIDAPRELIDQKKRNAVDLIRTRFVWERLIEKLIVRLDAKN
jgi:glycosyltransferase involved in cell wall biosynthesis